MNPLISKSIPSLSRYSRHALVEVALEEASRFPSVFTRLYPEAALAAGEHADAMRAAGVEVSPLAGLPVSIKDLLDVAGETTLAGSIALRYRPAAKTDAPVVTRLRTSGAAIMGKTNMTEFAYSGVGLNPHLGTPANPADPEVPRIPGGSSSGAAVSVATGLCVAAIGSDTGGSIRIPAALCGVVGFKPTARRVPAAGTIPLSSTLDTVCAITRSVDDCILVDSIIADHPLVIPELPLAGVRLAVPQTVMLDGLDAHVSRAFAAVLTRLSEAGAKIIESPFSLLAEADSLNGFAAPEAYAWHRKLLAERGGEYDSRVARRILKGEHVSAADYIDMHLQRRDWISRMEDALGPFDSLIMPTVPMVAPPIAELAASDDAFFRANTLLLRNTHPINLLDGCAVSLPCHEAGTLPVGLMVAGPSMADRKVLAVARAIEKVLQQ
ncbi:amidase [Noviherbaspirillum galbum]|uniref:Amidase n=1 Tax=Noviherbaspirillum galbum TaxID=2709383 RepID=A0A6B3SQE0_9BURK|nr:amidase [Noviherbaspirillum galbum]NEX62861.1 amidase [Noviherbaspirillum galbum]